MYWLRSSQILRKRKPPQIQEAFRTPNKQNQKRIYPSHIIVKTIDIQNKERIMKAVRENL
jgi:hypothetical protein